MNTAPPTITGISARQVLDCKCRPMVEVEIRTSDGSTGRGAAPTGQSVGSHEAQFVRDGDFRHYGGRGVLRAVSNVIDVIGPELIGRPVNTQAHIDQAMIDLDGTPDKSRLGGNAIYSTSIAVLRAAAASAGTPVYRHVGSGPIRQLPVPSFNMINGGRYGEVVQPFNEFLVVPFGVETADDAVEAGIAIFDELGRVLEAHLGHAPLIARSYGFAATSGDPRQVLMLMNEAVRRSGYVGRAAFALDCASSEMYDPESRTYLLDGARVTSSELVEYAGALCEEFPLLFIEDLLDEDDWEGHQSLSRRLPRTNVLGDDLIVTDVKRLERARSMNAVDGFILKPNQVGTITEALAAHDYARLHGMLAIPSGRSGGVIDDIVMDLGVGLHVPFQKNGAPRSGERIEKLNFLLRAADEVPGRRLARLEHLLTSGIGTP